MRERVTVLLVLISDFVQRSIQIISLLLDILLLRFFYFTVPTDFKTSDDSFTTLKHTRIFFPKWLKLEPVGLVEV